MAEGRYTLFSSDTLEGLRAATAAAHGAELRACELSAAAVADSDAGRTDEAKRGLAQAVELTSDIRLVYLAYQFHFRLGEYDAAERLVNRRLELARPESADEARAWSNYGLIHQMRGDLDTAETMLRRALEMDRRIGNDEGVARDLGNLSLIPEARGDLDEAVRLNRESLEVAERIGYTLVVASRLTNLGEIALSRGQREEARTLLTRAEGLFRQLGVEKYRAHCARLIEGLSGPAGP